MTAIKPFLQRVNKIDHVTGCVLSSKEGIIIDSLLREGKDDDLQAGICSRKLEKIKESLSRLNLGEVKQVNLYGEKANQCVFSFAGKLLIVNCRKEANINFIAFELEPVLKEIIEILG